MYIQHSTAITRPIGRQDYWKQVVTQTYFSLDVAFKEKTVFSGNLQAWDLGSVSLSLLESDPLLYQRYRQHLLNERDENYLITIPGASTIDFSQSGRQVECKPGGFIMQRSHLPYRFSYSRPNRMWVLKVPVQTLRARIGVPERLVSMVFDASHGAGELMVEMVRLLVPRLQGMDISSRQTVGTHLVDLLGLAVTSASPGHSDLTSVQSAHLYRAERYIRDHIKDNITPQDVADACGISLRYIHTLFQSRNLSVRGWIYEQRLLLSDEALQYQGDARTISEIAYEYGFGSPASFSRLYKNRFGISPSEAREKHRKRLSTRIFQ